MIGLLNKCKYHYFFKDEDISSILLGILYFTRDKSYSFTSPLLFNMLKVSIPDYLTHSNSYFSNSSEIYKP